MPAVLSSCIALEEFDDDLVFSGSLIRPSAACRNPETSQPGMDLALA
jgi:hypothetical protein